MVRSHAGNERGMALGIALFALIILGGLVSSAFFIGVQEQRIGQNTVKLQQAFAAADGGASAIVNGWNIGTYNGMVNGATVSIGRTALPNNSGWYRASVQRLSDQMFLVRAEGFNKDSTARQEIGLLARLSPIEIIINAALKTQGATKIGGSSFISGQDQTPTGWTCPATKPTIAGVRIPPADSTDITTSGCGGYSCLQGSPKIKTDSTINDSTLTTFGDVQWADMQAMANKVIGPGNYNGVDPVVVSGACNTAAIKNWGDPMNPTGPCGNYFPIIWATGDITVNGNIGQGILFVDGNLSVQGGFEFFGPVIVRRTLKTTGTGGHFNGGVISANIDLDQNTILGDAVINYSSCALLKALNASATGALIKERAWFAVR